ncbi:YeaH/YhbH family protein [Halococcus sediminicola]|uniref:YeaH/YhbH family protein n=1 Tax=Halococcus sediminicola TaxID=1264579 RepID=UPI0006794258|nr:YeaH/YhbH family protein [Halococcus sediminicola]
MGLREDLERYREVGEERREDLAEFIQYGDLGGSRPDSVRVPIKIVDLPGFEYDKRDQGGVGQGDGDTPEPGQQVGQPQPGDDEGEAGEEGGEHEYYEMNPEEFAQELDKRLGLDLEPKGKQVIEEIEGDYTDVSRTGPNSTLDFERMFKEGLKRKLAMDFDREYVREALRVDGMGPESVFEWARGKHLPVSRAWLDDEYAKLAPGERTHWPSIEAMEANVEETDTVARIRKEGIDHVPFRREDERYRYPEIVEEREKNVVVVNIRDVSGSMREQKRELVERTFTPLDWYLTGKYDHAEFVYIAHDAEAWRVEREEFFGIRSGGGTKISSAYDLAAAILDEEYPWNDWNRYVFAAGDSENSSNDTEENVIPLMEGIPANLHAYVETQPSGNAINATHAEEIERHFHETENVAVAYVNGPGDVVGAIETILNTEDDNE